MVFAEDAMAVSEHEAQAHVRNVAARSGSSFLWGMRLLPRRRRNAMYALYAFCREVDDIADEPGERREKHRALDGWRTEIDSLFAGEPTTPIAQALLRPVTDFDLPREEFMAIIDGMEMDLSGAMRAPSMAELRAYCRRVAGAVGLISIRIFGAREKEAEELALALGEALQLTNILRDMWEDVRLGRLYLPRELMEEHGIGTREPADVLGHSALPKVCADLAANARTCFGQCHALLAHCDRRRLRPSIIMMNVYERLLGRLEAQGWQPQATPVRLTGAEKLWVVLRHGLF